MFDKIEPAFSVKSVDTKARTFRGLSSTWELDLGADIVHKGAFTRTLDHWRNSGRTIALTDGHPEMESGPQVERVLGKMIDAAETSEGLLSEFKMRDTDKATEALEAIEGGFMTGLSITYKAIQAKREPPSASVPHATRHLHEVKLHSVGMVTAGMNPGAHADPRSVKSILELLQRGPLSDDDRAAFAALPADVKSVIRALLSDPLTPPDEAPVDTPKGLAPDDPMRIEMESRLRGLKLRSLQL